MPTKTILDAVAQVPGVVGLASKNLTTGQEIRHNAEQIFFTASTLKVPLLVELYRQVDQGLIDVNQRIELDIPDRVPGGGVLKELSSGLRPTIHDLAMLMIIISDNMATDILFHLVGRDKLNNTLADLGLDQTHLPMTCRELIYSVCGMEVSQPLHTLELATDKLKQQEFDLNATALSENFSDISSPDNMCQLLEAIYDGDILSATSRDAVLDILKRQQLDNVIPSALPPGTIVAHKTGTLPSIRCDVGIIFSPVGPYTLALMAKQLNSADRLGTDASLAAVSRAIYDEFTS